MASILAAFSFDFQLNRPDFPNTSAQVNWTSKWLKSLLYYSATFTTFVMSNTKKLRTIVFFKDYFEIFYEQQREKVKAKIAWTLKLIESLPIIPETYLKHIENSKGLYEIRVQMGSDIFRIFCFFDEGQLIILINGFNKKTPKTPSSEIQKALSIKQEYENEKK